MIVFGGCEELSFEDLAKGGEWVGGELVGGDWTGGEWDGGELVPRNKSSSESFGVEVNRGIKLLQAGSSCKLTRRFIMKLCREFKMTKCEMRSARAAAYNTWNVRCCTATPSLISYLSSKFCSRQQ